MNPHIQFTIEGTRPDGFIPFLEILVTHEQGRTLFSTMYSKPTDTD